MNVADRRVEAVLTHLEPLERPVAAHRADSSADHNLAQCIQRIVTDRLGRPPRLQRLLATDAGTVVFLVIGVGVGVQLAAAHRIASELEEILRKEHPSVAEVVVHTEP